MARRGDHSSAVVITVVAVSAATLLVLLGLAVAAYMMGRQQGMNEGALRRLEREVDILMMANGRTPPGVPPSV